MVTILKVISLMVAHIFRRGRGMFKLLFVIDDFIRLFTMTIMVPLAFSLISQSTVLFVSGLLLGIMIDVHDFVTEFAEGKVL